MNLFLQDLFVSHEVAAAFTAKAHLQGMLDFEVALAKAEARIDLIPHAAVAAINAKSDASLFDLDALAAATARNGNPAISMVERLTALVAQEDETASRFVHWGATSQDAIDTATVLQMRAAFKVLSGRLAALADALAQLTERHRDTPMVGRTLLQHALPITFGLKAAGWLSAIERHRCRLAQTARQAMVLQFGGAAGTLAALGDAGLLVAEALADELDLTLPELPWHSHRDRIGEVGSTLALLMGTLGKMARDVALLMQTEVAEAFESKGENGSSTLPQKHNPAAGAAILATAQQAPGMAAILLGSLVQEHERAVGGWPAEWIVLPELFQLTGGAVERALQMISGLKIDPVRMQENLAITRGKILAEAITMALGRSLGRLEAHEIVRQACDRAQNEDRSLRGVLEEMPQIADVLSSAELDRLFEPTNYVGLSGVLVDRVLESRRSRTDEMNF